MGRLSVAAASLGSHAVAADVDGNSSDPGVRCLVGADQRPPRVGLDEGVLGGIDGDLVVACRGIERSQDGVVVSDEKLFELGVEFGGRDPIGSPVAWSAGRSVGNLVSRLHSRRE